MGAIITYDELSNLVNAIYKFLGNSGILDTPHLLEKIRDEFNLTTIEVWELLGIKDLTDFQLMNRFTKPRIELGDELQANHEILLCYPGKVAL